MLHLAQSQNTSLSRCLLAGLAGGILAAILNVGYVYIYTTTTKITGGALFSPLSIFIGFPLLFLIAGLILFEMVEYVKKGRLLFTMLFLLITALAIILTLNRNGNGMTELLLGVILITGLLISLLLPFLATHAKIFMDKEEFTDSRDT